MIKMLFMNQRKEFIELQKMQNSQSNNGRNRMLMDAFIVNFIVEYIEASMKMKLLPNSHINGIIVFFLFSFHDVCCEKHKRSILRTPIINTRQ